MEVDQLAWEHEDNGLENLSESDSQIINGIRPMPSRASSAASLFPSLGFATQLVEVRILLFSHLFT